MGSEGILNSNETISAFDFIKGISVKPCCGCESVNYIWFDDKHSTLGKSFYIRTCRDCGHSVLFDRHFLDLAARKQEKEKGIKHDDKPSKD